MGAEAEHHAGQDCILHASRNNDVYEDETMVDSVDRGWMLSGQRFEGSGGQVLGVCRLGWFS